MIDNEVNELVKANLNVEYYASQFRRFMAPSDPVKHYLTKGWKTGKNPEPAFQTNTYLAIHGSEKCNGENAYVSWLKTGKERGEKARLNTEELKNFDSEFYFSQFSKKPKSKNAFDHYMTLGWRQGKDPCPGFSSSAYLLDHLDVKASGTEPFCHWLIFGKFEKRRIWPSASSDYKDDEFVDKAIKENFNKEFYLSQFPDEKPENPLLHYLTSGWKEGKDPSPKFSTSAYLSNNSDILEAGYEPFSHWLTFGRGENRQVRTSRNHSEFINPGLEENFDEEFYLSQFSDEKPEDPFFHYMTLGWREGRDPCPEFSTSTYLSEYSDVKNANVEPFTHFIFTGKAEGRVAQRSNKIEAYSERESNISKEFFDAHLYATSKGPSFEHLQQSPAEGRKATADVLVNYLPQFHSIKENDENWGVGFTEWTNLSRALPRFEGHIQPRVPRDFGFYDLSQGNKLAQQAQTAKEFGVRAFNFYYYWFDGKRVLDEPLERFLSDKSIDLEFCLTWANEN